MNRFAVAFMAIFSNVAFADICKWEDSNGLFHFGNKAPEGYNAQCVPSEESIEKPEYSQPAEGETRIISWDVQQVTESNVVFAVKYYYDGKFGDKNIWMSAETRQNGEPTLFYGYVPAEIKNGENIALVKVVVNQRAPKKYCSDSVKFTMYGKGIPTFNKATVKYSKCWLNTYVKPVESKPTRGIQ